MSKLNAWLLSLAALFMLTACGASETAVATAVAGTRVFEDAVAQAVGTGIAATMAALPTATATATPRPSETATATVTATVTTMPSRTPTHTPQPTETETPLVTPEPTATGTLTAGELKTIRLYSALRNLKTYADNLYMGMNGDGSVGFISCSRELRGSIVTNYERVTSLEVFDDTLLSDRSIGANISYNAGREAILENAHIQALYNHCVNWIDAGKPEDADFPEGLDWASAQGAAQQAASAAEAGLSN